MVLSLISDDSTEVPIVVVNAPAEFVKPLPVKSVKVSAFIVKEPAETSPAISASCPPIKFPATSSSSLTNRSPPSRSILAVSVPIETPPPPGLIRISSVELMVFPSSIRIPPMVASLSTSIVALKLASCSKMLWVKTLS